MEDWKKKYEETLRKAKEYYADVPGSRGFLDNIFPELAESEDERIINVIIGILKNSNVIDINVSQEKIIAWLEKQKDEAQKQFNLGVQAGREEVMYEMEKEQKPAEKQDYSGLNDLERAIFRGFLCAGVDNAPVTIIKETAQNCLTLIEQNPAGWSEEDEKMIKDCSLAITSSNYFFSYDERCAMDAWLKSLRPKPHWKPSEEQMEALQHAIDACECEWGYEDSELRSLLSDLQTKL